MANLFLVKHNFYDPTRPLMRFKPATTKSLIGAKTKAKAIDLAQSEVLKIVKAKFPTADIKLMECKQIGYDRFYQTEN